MTTSTRNTAGIALVVVLATLASHAVAGPMSLDLPPPVVIPVPTPGGGVIVGGQVNGTGGIITHQPHGGGYTTNGAQIGTPGGTTFGGSVTTDPSGRPIGGTINFGGNF